jgi:hypothetical protein
MREFTLALLCAVSLFAACDSARYKDEEAFSDVNKKLMASANELTRIPTKLELSDQPTVAGKIAVFQSREKGAVGIKPGEYFMDIYYFREMKDNYATTPEEVGTVALVQCKTLQKGVYKADDGREFPAMVEECDLTMIDRKKEAVIFKKMFEKKPQEDRKFVGNSVLPQSAQTDIVEFLKSLPKK